MSAKVTMVRLVADGRTESFELGHAENIMRLPNSRWKVAEGEKVEWTENGFKPRENKERGSKSE